ncbi:RNA-binding protein [Levilactobacillus brevis]|uniref:Nop6 protein n=1 Tax=Starmerella bacillaris TaxID=1247836 RepID=A0AAV5RL87_STABA|nr:RNA-binding protein [Levilactobacillus brevis]GMM51304.1 Nop6 protein [Starmerella bacillaris]
MAKVNRKEKRKLLFKKGSEARKASKPVFEKKQLEEIKRKPSAKRFILFVGNLPYTTTEEEIRKHFEACNISKVRLRSNGICFLEFEGENAATRLHHALQLHHSSFNNRRINVELSAGGGGNNQSRRDKIKQKNEDIQKELGKRIEDKKTSNSVETSKPKKMPNNRSKAKQEISEETIVEAQSKGINPARLAALKK